MKNYLVIFFFYISLFEKNLIIMDWLIFFTFLEKLEEIEK